jgi:hypothetical protein
VLCCSERTECSIGAPSGKLRDYMSYENCAFPVDTRVSMRLLHVFHISDGLIAREIGYEIWRRDD